jgi:starch-binding outer membrane protein SusE/F
MKKLFIITVALGFALLSACKKDKLVTVTGNVQAANITSPGAGTSFAVTVADSAQVLNVKWESPNYGVQAVVSYFVQVDSVGKNFKKFVTLANLASAKSFSISYNNFNNAVMAPLGLTPNAASTLELRVGTAIYGADTVFSKPVSLSVTTLQLDQLWLPGSYEGYNPAAAPTIPDVTPNATYEGYAYFSAAGNFKFTSAPDYGHTNYGYSSDGKLTTDGNAAGIGFNSAGVYLLDANVQTLTYSATYIQSFGIIGTATPGQWNNSTPMNYDVSTGLWSVTAALVPGALKFRANDVWDINYGPADSSALTGTLQFNNPGAITINDAGTYTITIDMTQKTQRGYYYTVVKN